MRMRCFKRRPSSSLLESSSDNFQTRKYARVRTRTYCLDDIVCDEISIEGHIHKTRGGISFRIASIDSPSTHKEIQ